MKADKIYVQLVDLADKFGIEVSEQSFRATDVSARSGLCKLEGKTIFFMDKHKPLREKINLLKDCLQKTQNLDTIYMAPKLREILEGNG